MNKTITFLAVALMTASALGVSYSEDFGGTLNNTWAFIDGAGSAEVYHPTYGQIQDAAGYNVTFTGGICTMADANATPADGPPMIAGLLSTFTAPNIVDQVAFTNGNVAVSGILNAAETATTTEQALLGFLQPTETGFKTYGMGYAPIARTGEVEPREHEITLFAYEDGAFTKLAELELTSQGYTDPMSVPIQCTMYIQAIASGPQAGRVSVVGVAYDVSDPEAPVYLGALGAVTGATDPQIYGGAVGFLGKVNTRTVGGVPVEAQPVQASCDDFLAQDDSGPLDGDADLDGDVDLDDLGKLADNWGTTSGATWLTGDYDYDGDVDLDDLGKLADNWGGTGAAPTSVPEPATMSLLAVGTLALLRRRK